MKLLVIDTSTEACSVALRIDDDTLFEYQYAPRAHTQLIFPMMERLLATAQISLSALDAFAFGRGPGSFTGVRIAASMIQGLAFAVDKPVVPVSTLQAMAQGAAREWSAQSVLVAIDARMSEVYWGCYGCDPQGIMMPLSEEQVAAPQQVVIAGEHDWCAVGSGWQAYDDALKARVSPKTVHAEFYPHAQDIAFLAVHNYQQGGAVAASDAIPVYLRDKVTN